MLASLFVLTGWATLFFRLRKPLIHRYEENGLTNTLYFQHEIFRIFTHPSWRKWTYSAHLFIVAALPLRLLKRSPAFRDLESKDSVLRHFSRREIRATIFVWGGFLVAIVVASVGLALGRLFTGTRPGY
jgi:hypothetical protein